MKNDTLPPQGTLAQRRATLVARCADERAALGAATGALLAPFTQNKLGKLFGARMKVPLIIAGGALGLVLTRPGRTLSLLSSIGPLWRLANGVLSRLHAHKQTGEP